MCAGQWLQPLNQMVLLLGDAVSMENCGLTVAFSDLELDMESNAFVAQHNEMCGQMVCLLLNVFRLRIRSCFAYSCSWPPEVCRSLGRRPAAEGVQGLQGRLPVMGGCRLVPLARGSEDAQEEPPELALDQAMVNYARRSGWETFSPAMRSMVESMLGPCFGQQKIIEDWLRMAMASESKSDARVCTPA